MANTQVVVVAWCKGKNESFEYCSGSFYATGRHDHSIMLCLGIELAMGEGNQDLVPGKTAGRGQ